MLEKIMTKRFLGYQSSVLRGHDYRDSRKNLWVVSNRFHINLHTIVL